MVNLFNVTLIELIRCNSVRFNWLTIIVKHHGQSVQRHLDRINTIQFGSIQLTHYDRKASWSIDSTSPCSNRATLFGLIQLTLSSQSIMVNRFNVALIESMQSLVSIRPGFHLQQTPRPRHKKQSDYVLEQSSLPLIALFWLKIGRCRGRNRLYGNQALSQFRVKTKRLPWRMAAQPCNRFVFVSWSWNLSCNGNQA